MAVAAVARAVAAALLVLSAAGAKLECGGAAAGDGAGGFGDEGDDGDVGVVLDGERVVVVSGVTGEPAAAGGVVVKAMRRVAALRAAKVS